MECAKDRSLVKVMLKSVTKGGGSKIFHKSVT